VPTAIDAVWRSASSKQLACRLGLLTYALELVTQTNVKTIGIVILVAQDSAVERNA